MRLNRFKQYNGDMMGYITHCKQFDMDVSANKGNSTKFMAISKGIFMITIYYHY
jgi:hypothetical protein